MLWCPLTLSRLCTISCDSFCPYPTCKKRTGAQVNHDQRILKKLGHSSQWTWRSVIAITRSRPVGLHLWWCYTRSCLSGPIWKGGKLHQMPGATGVWGPRQSLSKNVKDPYWYWCSNRIYGNVQGPLRFVRAPKAFKKPQVPRTLDQRWFSPKVYCKEHFNGPQRVRLVKKKLQ